MQISMPLELASPGCESGAVIQLRVPLFEARGTKRCSPRLASGQNDLLSFNQAFLCELHQITEYLVVLIVTRLPTRGQIGSKRHPVMEQFKQGEDTAILQLLGDMLGRTIVVVGDAMLDRYVTGPVDRISPEAPVPVIKFATEHHTLGGAGNVAQCAAALGAGVELIGVIGSDPPGQKLKSLATDLGIQVE